MGKVILRVGQIACCSGLNETLVGMYMQVSLLIYNTQWQYLPSRIYDLVAGWLHC